jgi:isomerase DpgB
LLVNEVCLRIASAQKLSAPLIEAINRTCDQVEDGRGDVAVLVGLQGLAPDADEFWPYDVEISLVNRWERALRRLERLPAPTVAFVDGLCCGLAVEALLTTDYRVAGHYLRVRLAARAGASWPSMAVHRLANQLGLAFARPMVLFGAEMSIQQAVAAGIVDEIVDDLPAATGRILDRLAHQPGRELAVRRQLLLEAPATAYDDALGRHLAACERTRRAMPTAF